MHGKEERNDLALHPVRAESFKASISLPNIVKRIVRLLSYDQVRGQVVKTGTFLSATSEDTLHLHGTCTSLHSRYASFGPTYSSTVFVAIEISVSLYGTFCGPTVVRGQVVKTGTFFQGPQKKLCTCTAPALHCIRTARRTGEPTAARYS